MHNSVQELKSVLNDAKHEILSLRRQNELLSAQVRVVNIFEAALGLRSERYGETIDVAWRIQNEIELIEAEEKFPFNGQNAEA